MPQRDLGVAIGLIGTFRSVGGSVGSVIFSSIFAQTSAKQIARRISNVAIEAGNAQSIPDIIEAVELTLVGVSGLGASLKGVRSATFDACVTAARYGYAYGKLLILEGTVAEYRC